MKIIFVDRKWPRSGNPNGRPRSLQIEAPPRTAKREPKSKNKTLRGSSGELLRSSPGSPAGRPISTARPGCICTLFGTGDRTNTKGIWDSSDITRTVPIRSAISRKLGSSRYLCKIGPGPAPARPECTGASMPGACPEPLCLAMGPTSGFATASAGWWPGWRWWFT